MKRTSFNNQPTNIVVTTKDFKNLLFINHREIILGNVKMEFQDSVECEKWIAGIATHLLEKPVEQLSCDYPLQRVVITPASRAEMDNGLTFEEALCESMEYYIDKKEQAPGVMIIAPKPLWGIGMSLEIALTELIHNNPNANDRTIYKKLVKKTGHPFWEFFEGHNNVKGVCRYFVDWMKQPITQKVSQSLCQ